MDEKQLRDAIDVLCDAAVNYIHSADCPQCMPPADAKKALLMAVGKYMRHGTKSVYAATMLKDIEHT